jgi:lipopolysaccharide export system permease protein
MIRRYLSRLVLGRLLAALIGLAAMLQLLELFEKAGTIFAHGGFLDILHFIALRLPAILAESLPLAVLIGALLAFRGLAAGLEVTTLRAAGMSIGQMVMALLPLCLLLTLVQFGLQNEAAPRADRAFQNWWARTIPAAADTPAPPPLWLRAGGNVAAVDSVSLDGRHLDGVTLIERSAKGDVTAEVTAPRAEIGPQGWVLDEPSIAQAGKGEVRAEASLVWSAGPSAANMVALARPTDSQTLEKLIDTLKGRWVGGQGPSYYRTALYEAFAVLFGPVIMLLLAAPVLLAPPRSEGNGMATATGLMLGLGYLVCAGLLNAFGESGAVPPWIAGGLVPVSFLAFAILRLMQADDS